MGSFRPRMDSTPRMGATHASLPRAYRADSILLDVEDLPTTGQFYLGHICLAELKKQYNGHVLAFTYPVQVNHSKTRIETIRNLTMKK